MGEAAIEKCRQQIGHCGGVYRLSVEDGKAESPRWRARAVCSPLWLTTVDTNSTDFEQPLAVAPSSFPERVLGSCASVRLTRKTNGPMKCKLPSSPAKTMSDRRQRLRDHSCSRLTR
jgi:hypothetical protein